MKFSIAAAVLALASAVVAHPGAGYVSTPEKEANFRQNFQKFVTACGNGNQVSCCNTETKKVGAPLTAGGLIPILNNLSLEDFALTKGCSKIDVAGKLLNLSIRGIKNASISLTHHLYSRHRSPGPPQLQLQDPGLLLQGWRHQPGKQSSSYSPFFLCQHN